jgi:hypothetical protein
MKAAARARAESLEKLLVELVAGGLWSDASRVEKSKTMKQPSDACCRPDAGLWRPAVTAQKD